jgi:hypothetical protein
MRPTALSLLALVAVIDAGPGVRAQGPDAQGRPLDCAALSQLRIANVRITEAAVVKAPASGEAVAVAHCRVSGVIDKETSFTELLPERWNGRFFAGGAGGFAGVVENQALASVNFGYATVGTDTGHQADGLNGRWALGNKERQMNYGYLAIHRTAEVAKAIVKAYYGADPRYSYFYGCSNGGRQGLMEVQRYPADFDGVVSCAPALDYTHIAAAFVRNTQLVFPDPRAGSASVITPDNLTLLESRVLAACDGLDGITDGVLNDPSSCDFKVSDLPQCGEDRPSADCLTTTQRAAIAGIYAPTTSQGKVIYPGQPFGGEAQPLGWPGWITPPNASAPSLQRIFGTEFFKYFVFGRNDWDYGTYDLSTWQKDTQTVARYLNADNPDLAAFKARGGKLILAHGWSDPALNPRSTIEYYQRLRARDPRVGEYSRLFMMPGVLHCQGGPGPDSVDWFAPIVDWVEHGRAPDAVIARKVGRDGRILNARPLCPYPQRATYDGKGSTTDASSYACKAP